MITEEIIETVERIKVMQAFVDGKAIEERRISFDHTEWIDNNNPEWRWDKFDYRIKPEPKYRPFKDAEECWQEMQKHQPFGWLKDKKDDHYILITAISNTDVDQITSNGNISWMFCSISKFYTFADGTPFGIKEE